MGNHLLSGIPGRALAAGAFVAALHLAGTSAANAQLFSGTDWFEREVADGVTWRYYQFDSLFGAEQSISWIEADLTKVDVELPYLAASRSQTSTMIPSQFPNAVAGVNGTFFDTSSGGGGATTYLRVGGAEINSQDGGPGNTNMRHQGALAKDGSDNVSIALRPTPSNDWLQDVTHPDIMANGPILQTGSVIPSFAPIGAHCSNRHPRTMVGVTADNRIILVTVDGRTPSAAGMTCDEMAEVMEEFGCTDSLSLDGGGSTTMWIDGEPFNGVVNYPSDNGNYDHNGERSCSNAIAIVSTTPAATPDFDGRLTGLSYTPNMLESSTQDVTLTYTNLGSQTWTPGTVTLETSRPHLRSSPLQHASWVSASNPVAMSPASVATGQVATFTFTLQAPSVVSTTYFEENFALYESGSRFGPADNAAGLSIFVEPPVGSNVIVESRRPNGDVTPSTQETGTSSTYSEPAGALSSTTSKSVIPVGQPQLVGVGARFTSNANIGRKGRFTPYLPEDGLYDVYVTVGATSNNDANATWVVNDGTATAATGNVHLYYQDSTVADAWKLLASDVQLPQGHNAWIEFTNAGGNNRFVMDAVRFELTTILTDVGNWEIY